MKYPHLLIVLSSISLLNALAVPSVHLLPLGSGSNFLEIEDVTQNLHVLQQLHLKKVAVAIKVRWTVLCCTNLTSLYTADVKPHACMCMHYISSLTSAVIDIKVNWQSCSVFRILYSFFLRMHLMRYCSLSKVQYQVILWPMSCALMSIQHSSHSQTKEIWQLSEILSKIVST